MNIHYIHLRYRDAITHFGGISQEVSAKGGLTIAYALDEEEPKLHIAFAKCSRKDLFNKKRGRTIASNRLEQGYGHVVKFEPELFNKLLEDRKLAYDYVLGAMVAILPESAHGDYYELVSG